MTKWTNKSVLSFAAGADPVEKIQEQARGWVLKAIEAGWKGPPYNPIEMAGQMGVIVEPSYDIADARTIVRGDRSVIEFNPSQSRERVRFSIAHEVAHLLFPDASEEVRHRGGIGSSEDAWQLEMLCNLAASEFVMPIGSLQLNEELNSIEEMMVVRRRYDVSVEAFMIRMAKTSNKSIGIFCASPYTSSETRWCYKVNYFIPSSRVSPVSLQGTVIPADSAAYRCTAIGYTDNGFESWVNGSPLRIEYVGVPAYRGKPMPRVIGLVHFDVPERGHKPIRYVHGNALEPRGQGVKVICQLVNDRAKKWGGGIAKQAARKYPNAEANFSSWIALIPPNERLGEVHFSEAERNIYVSSLVAQAGFGSSTKPRIRYHALEKALAKVAGFAKQKNASVHMPHIGTGAAGGNWHMIKDMIEEIFTRSDTEVVVYGLPPSREQMELF